MAYLNDDEKLLDQQGQGGTQASSSEKSPLVGASGGDVGTGVSTAGVGKGGQSGGWTNIQAYLNANKGIAGTGDAIRKDIGGTFDEEESKLTTSANDTKTQANNAVKSYSNQDLDAAVGKVARGDQSAGEPIKDYLKSQYTGPTQYSYGLGAKTQEQGSTLGDQNAFNSYMNQFYNKAAGGQISSGQLALQRQLDVNNPDIEKARQDLSSRYSGLQNMAGLKTQETNDAIRAAQSQYGQNQAAARDYLGTQGSALLDRIAEIEGSNPYGWSPKYGDLRTPVVNQYNAIQDFLGLGGQLPVYDVSQIPDEEKEPLPKGTRGTVLYKGGK